MEIQRADLGYRRRVIRTLCAVALLLLAVLIALRFWLISYSEKLRPDDLPMVVSFVRMAGYLLIAVCLAVLGVYLLRRGNLIVRGRRFPPRDVRAVRDTPIREGDEAVRAGRASQMAGLGCLMLAVWVAAAAWLLNARW